jgi:hypothetical protein|tara:strand:+ start:8348 stop:8608 length:261 start_codon:yes stop_codon:yes gene_type:complete
MKEKILSDNPIDEKIMTKKRFSAAVEHLVAHNNMSYIDAAAYVVEERKMDYKNMKKLLTDSLKQKIQEEAASLNLIKVKRTNKLPV